MVVTNTKATTEKSGCLQAEEGETPSYTAHGRQHTELKKRMGDTTRLQISLKLTQHSGNCNSYSNLNQCYWKMTECGVAFSLSLLPVFCRTLHSASLTIFPQELKLKKRLIRGTLDYSGSLVITVSILAIKYERWGNFSSRQSCH